ncbi:MAG: hypothetical protein V8K32_08575 [Candidatus Electrothrix gigas]
MFFGKTARILLVRPKYRTGLTRFASIATEPLELEYLAAAVRASGHTYQIWDGQLDGSLSQLCRTYQPDMVAITGYYPARDQMLAYARTVRASSPRLLFWSAESMPSCNRRIFSVLKWI